MTRRCQLAPKEMELVAQFHFTYRLLIRMSISRQQVVVLSSVFKFGSGDVQSQVNEDEDDSDGHRTHPSTIFCTSI